MVEEKMFPIQAGHGVYPPSEGQQYGESFRIPAGQVPWCVAELAYAEYSRLYGTDQSLQRLADRGGFSWCELVWLLRGNCSRSEFKNLIPRKTQGNS